jgi:hypothetical protein
VRGSRQIFVDTSKGHIQDLADKHPRSMRVKATHEPEALTAAGIAIK